MLLDESSGGSSGENMSPPTAIRSEFDDSMGGVKGVDEGLGRGSRVLGDLCEVTAAGPLLLLFRRSRLTVARWGE